MEFISETEHKAREARRCDGCGGQIEPGTSYTKWVGSDGGELSEAFYHPDCRQAEIALNRVYQTWGPDDWVSLGEIEPDEWPWLLECYPDVARRVLPSDDLQAEQGAK